MEAQIKIYKKEEKFFKCLKPGRKHGIPYQENYVKELLGVIEKKRKETDKCLIRMK